MGVEGESNTPGPAWEVGKKELGAKGVFPRGREYGEYEDEVSIELGVNECSGRVLRW